MELREEFIRIARDIETAIRMQAPSSKLQGAVSVVYERNGDQDDFIIALDEEFRYGIYLHRGTMAERDPEASEDFEAMAEAFIDRRFNPNPGKGKGGIKPRYWLNLGRMRLEIFQDEIDQAIITALEQTIEKELE